MTSLPPRLSLQLNNLFFVPKTISVVADVIDVILRTLLYWTSHLFGNIHTLHHLLDFIVWSHLKLISWNVRIVA